MCPHTPPCPDAHARDHDAARTVVSHPEQGWSLLCNGVVIFEDTGELLPGGGTVAPHRPTDLWASPEVERPPAAARCAAGAAGAPPKTPPAPHAAA